jgi:hypothetical protein
MTDLLFDLLKCLGLFVFSVITVLGLIMGLILGDLALVSASSVLICCCGFYSEVTNC